MRSRDNFQAFVEKKAILGTARDSKSSRERLRRDNDIQKLVGMWKIDGKLTENQFFSMQVLFRVRLFSPKQR